MRGGDRRATAAALAGVFAALSLIASPGSAFGGDPVKVVPPAPRRALTPPDAADPLTVYVMTMGPGSHPFFMFGHNAIWIRDRAANTDRVYNFGTFKFNSPRMIFDFLGGRLTYWLSVSSLPGVVAEYRRENRSVAVQELALVPEVEKALQARLEENARPENRAYKYDYFLDNCSTRVRDVIDAFVDGRLHASARAPARMTLRQQALRMTASSLPFYSVLDVVLGPDVDRPIDRWGEMFLPEELSRGLESVRVPGPAGERPLVASRSVLSQTTRSPPLQSPPGRIIPFLLAGLGLGFLFLALGWSAYGRPVLRVLFGLLVAGWGFVVGFIGCFLLYAWLFTDHVVTHRNQNVFLFAPWAIALTVLGIAVAMGRRWAMVAAFWLASLAVVANLVGSLLKLGIANPQQNGLLIALLLPSWIGAAVALRSLMTSSEGEGGGPHPPPPNLPR